MSTEDFYQFLPNGGGDCGECTKDWGFWSRNPRSLSPKPPPTPFREEDIPRQYPLVDLVVSGAIAKANEVPAAVAKKPGDVTSPGKASAPKINEVLAKTLSVAIGRVLDPVNARSQVGQDRMLAALQGIRVASPEKETAANTKMMVVEQQKSNQKLDVIKKRPQIGVLNLG
ncbi:MAG: hypothetical protein IIB22_04720 [Chloroflexi bacterium]|nr:hypothetical protein [Chloroflexota bacterium]